MTYECFVKRFDLLEWKWSVCLSHYFMKGREVKLHFHAPIGALYLFCYLFAQSALFKNYNIPYRRQLDASHGPARPWQQRPGEGPRSEVWQAEEGPRHRWPTSKKDIWNAITLKIFRSEAHCIVIHELILDMINSLKTWTFKNVCFVDTKQRKLFLKGWGYSRRRW